MMSYRKAAVLLHGISPRDRKWLLANLPTEAVSNIGALLTELENLGIPKDRTMLKSALDTAQVIGKQRSLVLRLDEYAAERIHEALRDEPQFIIRRILSIHSWKWSNDVKFLLLQSMDKKGGKQFLSSLNKSKIGHKSEAVLLESLLDKLEGIQPAVVAFDAIREAI